MTTRSVQLRQHNLRFFVSEKKKEKQATARRFSLHVHNLQQINIIININKSEFFSGFSVV
jgi:hypothetical protein